MRFSELLPLASSLTLRHTARDVDYLGLCKVERPIVSGLCFVKNAKFWKRLEEALAKTPTTPLGVIVEKAYYEKLSDVERSCIEAVADGVATVDDVHLCMAQLSKPFYERQWKDLQALLDGRQLGNVEIDPTASIAQGVFIGPHVRIAAHVTIMPGAVIMAHSSIGEGTVVYPNVTVYEFVEIGRRVRIHSGTVIGADGFGYHFHQGIHHKIWHVGGVRIEDDVEIGSNVSIDRGTFAETRIGAGTKIDNQVQIAHNVNVGRGCILCGQVGISGSATIGDYCVFGGRAGMGPDFTIGKGSQVAAGGLVGCDWPDGSTLGGHPARPVQEWMRGLAYIRKESMKGRGA